MSTYIVRVRRFTVAGPRRFRAALNRAIVRALARASGINLIYVQEARGCYPLWLLCRAAKDSDVARLVNGLKEVCGAFASGARICDVAVQDATEPTDAGRGQCAELSQRVLELPRSSA